jgi:hypothetical protein
MTNPFNEPPPDKPLFTLHGVDIMNLDHETKVMDMRVYVVCSPCEMQSDEIKERVNAKVEGASQYLIREGFIKTILNQLHGWTINVGIIGHTPMESNE